MRRAAVRAALAVFALVLALSVTAHRAGPGASLSLSVGAPAEALLLGGIWKGIKKSVSKVAHVVVDAVKSVAHVIVDAAKVVGGAIVTLGGKLVDIAERVGKLVGRGLEAVGKGIVAVGKFAARGIKTLAHFIAKLGAAALKAVKKLLIGQLGKFARSKLHDFIGFLGKTFGGNLRWLDALEKAASAATKVDAFLDKYVQKPLDVIESVLGQQHYLEYAKDPNLLIARAKEKLATWATDKAVDFAMSIVDRLGAEVSKALVELGLKILKHPLTKAIASLISKAIAAVTEGLGAILQPAIGWAIDELLDKWAIPKLAEHLVGLVLGKVEGFLRDKIGGLIRKGIDKVVDGLVSRYLQKWIDAYKSKTGGFFAKVERLAGRLQKIVDGANAILAKARTVTGAIRRLRDYYKKTCRTVIDRCCAIAASYEGEKRAASSGVDEASTIFALKKVVSLRHEYAKSRCRFGRNYCAPGGADPEGDEP